jgi:hypothetical protein
MENVPVSFGYTSDEETDGADIINITEEWKYLLHIVTVDYPAQYRRSFSIDLTAHLLSEGDWVEIADLNILLQADLANFANASKVRIGKVKGIIDPVFGVLEGYGAYFQNLYATKNVNIAGTLTAGDENGFSSTFYVGKIHKNVILNSITGIFNNEAPETIPETTPAGIGDAWQMGLSAEIKVQSSSWRDAHCGLEYCFSLWLKAESDMLLSVFQDEHFIGNITVNSKEWKRHYLTFRIKLSGTPDMLIRFECPVAGLRFTSPQLEAGATPSQYQPTDGRLSYVEDYGAWFSRGGIGGTIQNPLLRLNEDGSISSRDNSFVIKPDGTGHFAGGRFKWTKDTITLQDVTVRWEDLDEEAQENMLPKSVSLTGTDVFHYPDELENDCEPQEIIIYATEHNFTASTRAWQYFDAASVWKILQGENRDFLKILPNAHYWEERKVLSIKFIASWGNKQYEEIFTVRKQFDGRDSYSIYIASTEGTVFKNGIVGTTLAAKVMKGGEDVTDKLPENNFRWKRTSGDTESDALWNSAEHRGKTLEITGGDVYRKAVFDCEVIISLD